MRGDFSPGKDKEESGLAPAEDAAEREINRKDVSFLAG